MKKGIIGKKIGMTAGLLHEKGNAIPVTVIEAVPLRGFRGKDQGSRRL